MRLGIFRCAPLFLAIAVLSSGCSLRPMESWVPGREGGSSTLLVLNKAAATAWLLDTQDGRRLGEVATGTGPHEVAVTPDGQRALVTNYGQTEAGHSLTLLDLAQARVLKTIDLGGYGRPHGLAWLPDGRRAVVTAEADQVLLLIDVDAGRVEAAIPTEDEGAHMVVAARDGHHAWTSSILSGSVSLIDLQARRVLRQATSGKGAEGLDLSPDGSVLWVANRAENSLSVLDAQTLALRAKIPSADFPIRVKFTPDGRQVLVSHARSAELRVFDAQTRAPRGSVRFLVDAARAKPTILGERFGGAIPIGIAVAADGRRAFVALAGTDEIAVVDLQALRIESYWPTGREPDGLALSPVRPR